MAITSNPEQFLWVEKYRPRTIADTIMPDRVRKQLQPLVDSKSLSNLLFVGSAGIGKTTLARALCEELDIDYILINCSENGNIDTIRTTVRNFASTMSLMGDFKCVIFDEADGLTLACLDGRQKVTIVDDGVERNVPIEEIVDTGEHSFVTYDFETNKEKITQGYAYISGERQVFKYTFDDGSEVFCTDDHKFFDEFGNEVTLDIGVEVISR